MFLFSTLFKALVLVTSWGLFSSVVVNWMVCRAIPTRTWIEFVNFPQNWTWWHFFSVFHFWLAFINGDLVYVYVSHSSWNPYECTFLAASLFPREHFLLYWLLVIFSTLNIGSWTTQLLTLVCFAIVFLEYQIVSLICSCFYFCSLWNICCSLVKYFIRSLLAVLYIYLCIIFKLWKIIYNLFSY